MSDTFKVGDREFELAPLPVEVSLDLLTKLAEHIAPAVASGNVADLGRVVAAVPVAYRTFVKHCKVRWTNGSWVDLAPFEREIFQRNHALLVAWLAECVQREFGSFFAADSRRLFADLAGKFQFPIGSIGGSGE